MERASHRQMVMAVVADHEEVEAVVVVVTNGLQLI